MVYRGFKTASQIVREVCVDIIVRKHDSHSGFYALFLVRGGRTGRLVQQVMVIDVDQCSVIFFLKKNDRGTAKIYTMNAGRIEVSGRKMEDALIRQGRLWIEW